MILVIGGTGTIGRPLVARLGALGVSARVLTRQERSVPPVAAASIEVVHGDAGNPDSLGRALTGVRQVFLAMGNGPRQHDLELGIIRAAAAAGVEHLVKVSAPVVGPDVGVAIARMHFALEQAVRTAGPAYTFLRPYAFLQNLLNTAPRIARTGTFAGITGDTPLNLVDARDIADVAAVALTSDRTHGRALVLTGPEAVSHPEVARRLTALGRPTRYRDQAPAAFAADLAYAGLPPWLVEHLTEIQELALRFPETPTGTVAELTGHPPRGLDAFLVEHLDRFRATPDRRLAGV